ncbi:hypothetical protein M2421_002364 [Stenotrophomonas sp. BIGb0135]|nr:hypothetical protein [Stenotrophomonas sp. BIGb0135]
MPRQRPVGTEIHATRGHAPAMTRDVKNPVDPRHAWIPRAARQCPPTPGDRGATRPSDVHPRPKKTVRVHGAGTESIHAWRGSTIDPLQYGPANDPRRKKSRRSTPCVDTARSAATPAEAAWPRRNQPVRRSTPAEEDRPGSWRRNGEHPRMAWIHDRIRVHTAPAMTRDVKNPVDPRHAWIPRAARQRPPTPGDHGATRPSDVHPRPKKTVRVHGAGTESIHAWRGSTIDPRQYGPANDPRRKKPRRSTPCVDTARSAATPAEARRPRRNQTVRRSTPAEEDRPGS